MAPVTGTGPPKAAETAVTARASPAGASVTSSRPSCHGTCPHMPSRTVI